MLQTIKYRFSKRQNKCILLLIKVLDKVGYLFHSPKEFRNSSNWETLGIVMPSHIGDMVLSQPLFTNLKRQFPDKKIVAVVGRWNFEIVKHYFDVDEVVEYNAPWHSRGKKDKFITFIKSVRKIKFDLLLETRGDLRDLITIKFFSKAKSIVGYKEGGLGFLANYYIQYPHATHEVERYLRLSDRFGCERKIEHPNLNENKKELSVLKLKKPYIVVHVGVGASSRRWEDAKFAELINNLSNGAKQVVVMGNKTDRERYDMQIDSKITNKKNVTLLLGMTNFVEAIKICRDSDLFIGLESGFTHIATALGINVVAIYSAATDPVVWGPKGSNGHVIVIRQSPPCQMCGELECEDNICMKDISVETVLKEIRKSESTRE